MAALVPGKSRSSSALGLGLGFGLGALANLIVVAVGPRETGVATAMNTVMRTLGGAFGAAIAAECLARGGSLDGDFALAFALCAVALALGVVTVLAIPAKRRTANLRRGATVVPCPRVDRPKGGNVARAATPVAAHRADG